MKSFLATRFQSKHLIEFRAIKDGAIKRYWSTLAELDAIEPELRNLDANCWNIYAGVNPRSGREGNEQSVSELVAFHVDLDVSPAPREKSLCEEPSMIVSSGRGRHLYWILDSPVAVTDVNREYLKAINRGLAKAVGGDAKCCDLSRILRVPGFHNHKENPPLSVELIQDYGHRYPLAQFESFAVEANYPAMGDVSLPDVIPEMNEELDVRFRRLWGHDAEIKRAWRGEVGDGDYDSRFVLVKLIAARGFSAEEIYAIVSSRRWWNKKSKHVRPAPDVDRDARILIGKFCSNVGRDEAGR